MSSVFVSFTSTDDLALEVASFFAKLQTADKGAETEKEKDEKNEQTTTTTTESPFLAEAKALIEQKDLAALVSKFVDALPLLFGQPEKDVENCINLISALLRNLDPTTLLKLVTRMVEYITASTEDRALFRLRIVGNLYNLLDVSSPYRFDIFMALVKYVVESNTMEVLIPQFSKFEGWLKQWGASAEQARALYLLVRKIYLQSGQHTLAHEFLVKYLNTFTSENEADASMEHVREAAVEAIRLPDVVQIDHLLHLPAVKRLEQADSLLYALLKLFAQDSLDAFHKFHKENPNFVESAGLNYEDCLKKMRLLSLATLGSEQSEVAYSLVSETLSIDEADVESWIIQAISASILDAKMDQLRRVVIINGASQRVFTRKQWEQLAQRLNEWKESTTSLLSIVGKTHPALSAAKAK